ncbi:MAG: hypothetical protein KKE62_01985 [Proteobacteria bacterium]|nr:hypothetical protein [Pseudomonadota bacterium]MBU1387091.1 hypothetical protein [Pseudomonadota bacterium]MBU1541592.1 hypothetical protein [Pseudomonadota bacterium]MBU2430345.1 hypothetical protein [Pseudomonadota bacterium]MBU2482549.1 hypothetical protein [Pseudomonadota bacterium]
MPRVLGGTSTMIIQDNLSDCKIHLQYRMPSSKEIISYRNGGMKRVKNNIENRIGENRLEHGLKILTGIRDGDFQKRVDGNPVDISSDPKSKNYDPDWKNVIKEHASDLIETLAVQVFDGSSQVVAPESAASDGEDTEGN